MTEIIVADPLAPDQATLKRAVTVLIEGGVVAYPTETFYALGVDALNPEALEKLFQLKGRAKEKPVSVIVADHLMLSQLISHLPAMADRLIKQFWPGPLTLILPGRHGLPGFITNEAGGVAVRISSHPLASALASLFEGPISATSANIASQPPPSQAAQVYDSFAGEIDLLLDGGETEGEDTSTLVDLTTDSPRILREGRIKSAAIFELVG